MGEKASRAELDDYVVELVGSSLRHSFRTPLSIVVNALREVESELKSRTSRDPKAVEAIKRSCAQVYRLRSEALEHYQAIGLSLKAEHAASGLQQIRLTMTNEVEPRLRKVRALVQDIKLAARVFKVAAIEDFTKVADLEANRALRIYDGIVKIIGMTSDMKLLETVSLWGRLVVAATQVRQNFELSEHEASLLEIPRQSASIDGSRALIDLLFVNILENAVRYARRATVFAVRVTIEELSAGEVIDRFGDAAAGVAKAPSFSQIDFANSGEFVPEGKEADIFRLYWTSEQPSDRSTGGGSGVGLALSRLIAELHGGFIVLNRNARQMTTFSVILPLP